MTGGLHANPVKERKGQLQSDVMEEGHQADVSAEDEEGCSGEEGVNKLYSRAVESKAISARLKSDIDTLSATAEAIKQRMRYFKTI